MRGQRSEDDDEKDDVNDDDDDNDDGERGVDGRRYSECVWKCDGCEDGER
mgnify:CR=1 FL=1